MNRPKGAGRTSSDSSKIACPAAGKIRSDRKFNADELESLRDYQHLEQESFEVRTGSFMALLATIVHNLVALYWHRSDGNISTSDNRNKRGLT
jgi:hypothetical protein